MPKLFIGLQAGHQNIQSNCELLLRGGTGAAPAGFTPERDWTPLVRNKVGALLIARGFQVQLDDANANCSPLTTTKDFDFYLAIHFESNTHGQGGGFMTAPDPSVDASNEKSRAIVAAIKSEYFKNTGIIEHEEWITNNMTFYYMWHSLSAATPCGIIECGVGGDAHDNVILGDIDRIAAGIARGICKAFNIPFDNPPAPPGDPLPFPPNEHELFVEALSHLNKIWDIIWGKGWPWAKINQIKKILPK